MSNDQKIPYCPLIQAKCLGERCMWHVQENSACSIWVIAMGPNEELEEVDP